MVFESKIIVMKHDFPRYLTKHYVKVNARIIMKTLHIYTHIIHSKTRFKNVTI